MKYQKKPSFENSSTNNYLTENQVVKILEGHFKRKNFEVTIKTGYQHGIDVDARKGNEHILVEAKGAKANKFEKHQKENIFTRNQIKTHLGVAIVQALSLKRIYPKAQVGVAHPDTKEIRELVDPLAVYFRKLEIIHYWVSADGDIKVE